MSLPAENVRQIEPPALVTMTPMDMLARAVQSGADLDMIEKLMNLQERWEGSNARKAFDAAIASAKAKDPADRAQRHRPQRQALCRLLGDRKGG
jgi:hypothetical protein